MGKAKKMKVTKSESSQPKVSLVEQMEDDQLAKMKNRQKLRFRTDDEEEVRKNLYL